MITVAQKLQEKKKKKKKKRARTHTFATQQVYPKWRMK
jgi:hypothetical protein